MRFPLVIFRVSGHSMEPTLTAGQFVLVYRWAEPKVGDVVVVNDTERDILIVKRIVNEVGPGKWKVAGDNPGHEGSRVVNKSEIIGKVIWY